MNAHLHCKSYYSFLEGADSPSGLIDAACRGGIRHLALTDREGVFGSVEFARKAEEAGVHPVIGAEITFRGARVVVLCRNAAGYAALCRTLTERGLAGPRQDPGRMEPEWEFLKEDNWLLVSEGWLLERIAARAGVRRLAAELVRHGLPGENRRLATLLATSRRLGAIEVASNDTCFADVAGIHTHRLLTAIRRRETIGRLAAGLTASPEAWLKSSADMASLFRDCPAAMRNASMVAEDCSFRFTSGKSLFPPFPVPAGDTAREMLARAAWAGLASRFADVSKVAENRLAYELEIIHNTGFDEYFLIVCDLVAFAQRKGIPLTGRGSAGGSLVAYSLGITHVDPLALNLSFERFLNQRRTDPPDIDIDFCWRRRKEVIRYLYDTYGQANVAMLSTHVRMDARGALRETAKAIGLTGDVIGRFTRYIPHFAGKNLEKAFREIPECRNIPFDQEPYRSLVAQAKKIIGHPRHLGLHPCGIVISRIPLDQVVPLQLTASGLAATQLEMRQAEDVGLLKIDILGQRALTVIADVEKAFFETGNTDSPHGLTTGKATTGGKRGNGPADQCVPPLLRRFSSLAGDPGLLDCSDPVAWTLIRAGRTLGCFQIESPGMRSLLLKLQPRDMETIIAASSVIRPGPSDAGMLREYILRYHGLRPVNYLHPALEPILERTLGIMVYQEDILRTAVAVAGMEGGEADMLRRAMSAKRSAEAMRALKDTFIRKSVGRGVDEPVAQEIWRRMETFSGYAFCKAHSASYAFLSWTMAWMKAHLAGVFFASLLNNGGGFYHSDAYLSDARRFGLGIRGPDLNASELHFTTEDVPGYLGQASGARVPEAGGGYLRVGLERIKGLSREFLERLVAERRARGPFRSLPDFQSRCDPTPTETTTLIRCGAFSGLEENRPRLLWEYYLNEKNNRRANDRSSAALFSPDIPAIGAVSRCPVPEVPDYTLEEKLRIDEELLELHICGHPLELAASALSSVKRIRAVDMPRHRGRRVRLAGRLVTCRRVFTKTRQYMKFLTLEDETDLFEVVMFPERYGQIGHVVPESGLLLVEGRVAEEFGSFSLEALALHGL